MICWEDIVEEVQEHAGYREALVRVFRRYEGQDTDERTAQNHIVKVTVASFARHFGIPKMTFHNWVNPPPVESTVSVPSARSEQLPPADSPNASDWNEWEQQVGGAPGCYASGPRREFLINDMIRSCEQLLEAARESDEFTWVLDDIARLVKKLNKHLQREVQA